LSIGSISAEVSQRRFGGLSRLYGSDVSQRIQNTHMAVAGVGGVGSWAVEALARSGVRRITLIDMDHVSESNINRQLHATSHSLGQSKVIAMQERIQLINPECDLQLIDDFVNPENVTRLFNNDVDLVIDATDQVSAKIAMAVWAMQHQKPLVMVGAAGGKKHAHLVEMADLADASHDPLLAQVRQGVRKAGLALTPKVLSGVHAVFSKEPVKRPSTIADSATDNTLNCHGYGSLVTVTATFGLCAAGYALNHFSE
jgi:tRNA A37 threonylcarbamoyladenosine dehydratase